MNRPAQVMHLDWSDPDTLEDAWDILSEDQQTRLDNVWTKVTTTNRRLRNAFGQEKDAYLSEGSLNAMSDWHSAEAFSHCGFLDGCKAYSCRNWKLCPRCSHHKKWNAWCRFALQFAGTEWHFLTISFSGLLDADTLGYASLTKYWDFARTVLAALARTRKVRGFLWREELHAGSLYPLGLRPHLHSVCDAPNLTLEDVQNCIDTLSPMGDADLVLPVNIDCRPIESAQGLVNRLGYVHKTMKLTKAYRRGRDAIGVSGDLTLLNRRLNWMLGHFSRVTFGRAQLGSHGSLHPLCNRYVGTPPKVFALPPRETPSHAERRRQHRKKVADLLGSFNEPTEDED